MENKGKDSSLKKSNMGLAIALGAGAGLIFGQFAFDNAGLGLVIGAGLGITFIGLSKGK